MNIREENARQCQTMQENFRRLREKRGWSVKELSEISGISEHILAAMERSGDFDVLYLFELCDLYGIKPREIFFPIV